MAGKQCSPLGFDSADLRPFVQESVGRVQGKCWISALGSISESNSFA